MLKKHSANVLFEEIWQDYNFDNLPFLLKLKKEMKQTLPYKGLRVYHNIPLTLQAVVKVHLLTLGGAEVVASGMSLVSPNSAALELLIRSGISVDLDKTMRTESFDVHLDCCAELINFSPPALGTVELTQTGSNIYKNKDVSYPVISIGDSKLKQLEVIGTGLSCVEAIISLTKQPIFDKKFMVFGGGKVGRGVVRALKSFTNDIVIVEKDQKMVDLLASNNYNVYRVESTNFSEEIRKELKDTYCIITATGLKGCLSELFDREELTGIYLANAGAEDEFGEKFLESDALFAKKPVNFSLHYPTVLHYLDPVLYAHNFATNLLLEKQYSSGYHVFPDHLSQEIIEEWAKIHNQNIEDIFAL